MRPPVDHKDVGPNTKLCAVEWYQSRSNLHPLTCGNDSQHSLLVGNKTNTGKAYLECLDCDYIQTWIPDYVWRLYIRKMAFGAASVQAPYGHVRPNVGDEDED